MMQLTKTEGGIKVRTDHGEEIVADVVLFATGNIVGYNQLCRSSVHGSPELVSYAENVICHTAMFKCDLIMHF